MLGRYREFTYPPGGAETVYRIAIYEECLITGEKRIREIHTPFSGDFGML